LNSGDISISRDGFVDVADRPNNRIQVFRKDGTYVKEVFISKRTLLQARRPALRSHRIRSSGSST
jgi:hypothetical protein